MTGPGSVGEIENSSISEFQHFPIAAAAQIDSPLTVQ
jgi:hypothetical protein